MKICVIGGGGAIGGYLAVMLARAGNDVTVVARGATLKAIQERGLALITNEEPEPLHEADQAPHDELDLKFALDAQQPRQPQDAGHKSHDAFLLLLKLHVKKTHVVC